MLEECGLAGDAQCIDDPGRPGDQHPAPHRAQLDARLVCGKRLGAETEFPRALPLDLDALLLARHFLRQFVPRHQDVGDLFLVGANVVGRRIAHQRVQVQRLDIGRVGEDGVAGRVGLLALVVVPRVDGGRRLHHGELDLAVVVHAPTHHREPLPRPRLQPVEAVFGVLAADRLPRPHRIRAEVVGGGPRRGIARLVEPQPGNALRRPRIGREGEHDIEPFLLAVVLRDVGGRLVGNDVAVLVVRLAVPVEPPHAVDAHVEP